MIVFTLDRTIEVTCCKSIILLMESVKEENEKDLNPCFFSQVLFTFCCWRLLLMPILYAVVYILITFVHICHHSILKLLTLCILYVSKYEHFRFLKDKNQRLCITLKQCRTLFYSSINALSHLVLTQLFIF